ncbi:MAG: DUF3137 domain-containing protein [Phycisphaera sp.]|nr:DUF3137 domain-containing protein [Phycisphaera sp.]
MEILLGVIVGFVVLVAIGVGWHLERKRTLELSAFASRVGLSFSEDRDRTADERFARFAMFRRGRSRSAWNLMRGRLTLAGREVELELGDFRYTVSHGSGKNRRSKTYKFSYLVAINPIGQCPETIIRQEGLFDRVKGILGFDDIDFESEEFSRKFHVSSDEKRFAYDLIDQRMMEYILADLPPAVELDGRQICISDGRGRWDTDDFERAIGWLDGILERWPSHLAKSLADREAGDVRS